MAPHDYDDKWPEAQESEEPTQDTRQPPPPPNYENCPGGPLSDRLAALNSGPSAFPLTKLNPDHEHNKRPKFTGLDFRKRPVLNRAINSTSGISKPSPLFPADKSQANNPKLAPPLEFIEVAMLEKRGKELALCLMEELSLYSSNPEAQNLSRVKDRENQCIKLLQDTGKKILKLLKQQQVLSAELRRVSGKLTETVVVHDFCDDLQPLEDVTLMRNDVLVLIKKIIALLRHIRKISVTREFVKQSLVAVPLYVSGTEQQNALLADLDHLSKLFGRMLWYT